MSASALRAWQGLVLFVLSVALLPCSTCSRQALSILGSSHRTHTRLPRSLSSPATADATARGSTQLDGSQLQKSCPLGCDQHGTCNRELGRCDCPVGFEGPDCSVLKYPDCMPDPAAPRAWCGTWHPKSCECVRQCKAVLCPAADEGRCRYFYDWARARCFERRSNSSSSTPQAAAAASLAAGNASRAGWKGGSDIPLEGDTSVTYYSGIERSANPAEGVITRQEFLTLDPNPSDNPLLAAPLADCPARCHLRGLCVKRQKGDGPTCICHLGFKGLECGEVDTTLCLNNCSARGECKAGFCHCQPGYWGRDCGRSRVYAPSNATRALPGLRVYAYDLPMEVAWQPEYAVGVYHHDSIYLAWQAFMQQFYNDTLYRTDNPWEANLYYIPAMTYAFSSNLGDTTTHARSVIRWVAHTYPWFNRSGGVDHFLWLTNDRGACAWPGDSEPDMANVMKVVHFGWANSPSSAMAHHFGIANKRWGCFHPLRDVAAPPFWAGQGKEPARTYGPGGTFDPAYIPPKLFFFAGGMRHNDPSYSFGVRQAIWQRVTPLNDTRVTYVDGGVADYVAKMRGHKYCLAPAGHGWGIRLSQYMLNGCVPVIIQDGVYQPLEEVLPYHEFSIRLSKRDIPHLLQLLEAIPDAQYLALRGALAKYWAAFSWDTSTGGRAFHYVMQALQVRVNRLRAGHIHVIRHRRGSRGDKAHVDADGDGKAAADVVVEVDDGHGGGEGEERPPPTR